MLRLGCCAAGEEFEGRRAGLQDCEGDAKGLLSGRPLARAAYFFLAVFLAGFLAAVFLAAVFFAAGFFAAAFFAAGFAAAFLVLDFFSVVVLDSLISDRFDYIARVYYFEVSIHHDEC